MWNDPAVKGRRRLNDLWRVVRPYVRPLIVRTKAAGLDNEDRYVSLGCDRINFEEASAIGAVGGILGRQSL